MDAYEEENSDEDKSVNNNQSDEQSEAFYDSDFSENNRVIFDPRHQQTQSLIVSHQLRET